MRHDSFRFALQQIFVNGNPFCNYSHRFPPQRVQIIRIDGDLELQSLNVTAGPNMEDTVSVCYWQVGTSWPWSHFGNRFWVDSVPKLPPFSFSPLVVLFVHLSWPPKNGCPSGSSVVLAYKAARSSVYSSGPGRSSSSDGASDSSA